MFRLQYLAAGIVIVLCAPLGRADFLFQTTRNAITTGMFTGDDSVELKVMNDGQNGTGTTLLAATVTFESYDFAKHKLAPGQFFIRAYDFGMDTHFGGDPSSDPRDNDMDISGFGGEFPPGTYARFGSTTQWTLAGSSPMIWSSDDPQFTPPGPGEMLPPNYPSSGNYTDGQAVAGPITVIGGANLTSGGVNDTIFRTLALAVVPHNEEVVFDLSVAGSQGPAYTGPPIADPIPIPSVPEPTSLGLLGLSALMQMTRRRRGGVQFPQQYRGRE